VGLRYLDTDGSDIWCYHSEAAHLRGRGSDFSGAAMEIATREPISASLQMIVLAARAAKISTVILPKLNERDLVDVPEPIKRDMTFFFVEHVEDVLKIALLDHAAAGEKTTERAGRESKPLATPEPATAAPEPVGQPG